MQPFAVLLLLHHVVVEGQDSLARVLRLLHEVVTPLVELRLESVVLDVLEQAVTDHGVLLVAAFQRASKNAKKII
jgi:hypothetical protein